MVNVKVFIMNDVDVVKDGMFFVWVFVGVVIFY